MDTIIVVETQFWTNEKTLKWCKRNL